MGRIRVTFLQRDHPDSVATKVPVAFDGSFRAELNVPLDARPGFAGFHVAGSPFDRCDDTASCVGYGASFTVLG
jgi:hypothetical protein